MRPALVIGSGDFGKVDFDWNSYRRLVAQWQKMSDCMLGNYYPLTEYSLAEEKWIAWQFNRPGQGDGGVQVFRRTRNEDASKVFHLFGLHPESEYEVADLDTDATSKISGKELMERGLTVKIETIPGAAVIVYRKSG